MIDEDFNRYTTGHAMYHARAECPDDKFGRLGWMNAKSNEKISTHQDGKPALPLPSYWDNRFENLGLTAFARRASLVRRERRGSAVQDREREDVSELEKLERATELALEQMLNAKILQADWKSCRIERSAFQQG